MFDQFTDRARRALMLANQEAQRLGHDHIGTEHLLLGMLKEGGGVGAVVLKNRSIDLTKARQAVERDTHPPSRQPLPTQLPQSERYKRVLETAVAESTRLASPYVGTEHLLLGLLSLNDGTAARVLKDLGLKSDDVRQEIISLLASNPQSRDSLLAQGLRDADGHLRGEPIDEKTIRAVVQALINAGWRPW